MTSAATSAERDHTATGRDDSIPTRQSLLARLQDLDDQASWREFFETYWRLIHNVALKAGLTPSEAQEAVQETMIAAARKLPGFTYDPAKDSFKGWLLHITRYRIADQFRKRLPALAPHADDATRTALAERTADPASFDWNSLWDAEWEEHLVRAALERVKQQVKPEHYEIYHLHVLKERPVLEVARTLGVNVAQVYLVKHRLGRLAARAIAELRAV